MVQWITVGDVDVDIGANPSAEEVDEGTESTNRKVVDIVDSFRLVVRASQTSLSRCLAKYKLNLIHVCRSNQAMIRRASWVTSRCEQVPVPVAYTCQLNHCC